MTALPDRARVVIIGGGICGLSTAYHLACLGWSDVVVLERHQLTSGTTWHAAGLIVSGGLGDETILPMFERSRHLYESVLERETGQATGYRRTGYIQVADTPQRAEALRREMAFQHYLGIEAHEISVAEVASQWPLAQTTDLVAGFWYPNQGRVNPVDAASAFAAAARRRGVRIVEQVGVTGIRVVNGTVTGAETTHGFIEAEHVVNCAGLWARQIGLLAGVDVPLQAAEHYYVITEQLADLARTTPVLEDPSRYGYFREEVGALLIGLFEPTARAWQHHTTAGQPFVSIEPDLDRIMPFLDTALGRLRGGHELGIATIFCGPESFTPDLSMLLGEAANVTNFWVLAGMNSLGILLGGGAGEVLAQWMVDGRPPVDVTAIDIARFGPWANQHDFLSSRVVEQLGAGFADSVWPQYQPRTGRDLRQSALHERMSAAGAQFVQIDRWEVPEFFLTEGPVVRTETFDRPAWFETIAAEHRATREAVGIFDMSMMAKLRVRGPDAVAVLDRLSISTVDVQPGGVVFTLWTDDHGGVVADVTVFRMSHDECMVVCGPEHVVRVRTWIERHTDTDARAQIFDVTDETATINVQGPRSRELLRSVTGADLSSEHHPHLQWRHVTIGESTVLAARITYVGELGYELMMPSTSAVDVFDRLMAVAPQVGARLCGTAAMESLRIEKGNVDYSVDMDNTDTPFHIGLGFLVDTTGRRDFIGRGLLTAQHAAGPPSQRLVRLVVDEPTANIFGHEPVLGDGVAIGHIRSGHFGHTIGKPCCLAWLEADEPITATWLAAQSLEVTVNDRLVPAQAQLKPWYDPAGSTYRHV